jgi:hypothetical protein
MRTALQNAISRRDDRLARTRRLSVGIAAGATVASVGLAVVLGTSIPGRAASVTTRTPATSRPAGPGSADPGRPGTGRPGTGRPGLTPPSQPPGGSQPSSPGSAGAPVVHSGGS